MSVTRPNIPLDHKRAFTTGLGDFIDPSEPLWTLLSQNYTALEAFILKLELPQKSGDWVLRKPSVAETETSVSSTGWRFWASAGDLYCACHVGRINEGPPKMTGFSTVVQVLADIERFNQLSAIPELAGTAFEPHVLRIAWYPLEAFWLRSTVADVEDHFVVFSGFPPEELDSMEAYPMKTFLKAIDKRASELRARK
ncbi:MAG TPA: hypothetical protein VMT15_16980 [Bryobacteraceae bacterium]|nr:hypothetical protein [Bryobacteraceae bacterium]